jgi:hypothetical protein
MGIKMKIFNIKLILLSLFTITIFISFVACSSKDEKVKKQFVSTIEKEFDSLKTYEYSRKLNPNLHVFHRDEVFSVDYREYTGYGYNIEKTKSIVSPYTGFVEFKFILFMKHGNTEQGCLDSEWKKEETGCLVVEEYAYQDGSWVFKKIGGVGTYGPRRD